MPIPGMLGGMVSLGGELVDLPAAVDRANAGAAPATITASVIFNRDGTITNDASAVMGYWVTPAHPTVGDQYEVKHTFSSGSALSSAPAADDTYIGLTANRTYSNSAASSTRTTVGVFSVRQLGGSSAADTAPSTIEAEST